MRILSESHLETRSKALANALVGVVRRLLPRPTPTTCAQKRLWVSSKASAIIYLTKRSSSLVHQPRLLWKLRGTPCWILILPTSSCVSRFRVSPDYLLQDIPCGLSCHRVRPQLCLRDEHVFQGTRLHELSLGRRAAVEERRRRHDLILTSIGRYPSLVPYCFDLER